MLKHQVYLYCNFVTSIPLKTKEQADLGLLQHPRLAGWLETVNYDHKELHPGCCSSPVVYAGPLFACNIYGDERTLYKSWIFIFTYASARYLFLELVPVFQLNTCVRAMSRSFSERDVPSYTLSDNLNQFSSSDTEVKLCDIKEIKQRFNSVVGPEWE